MCGAITYQNIPTQSSQLFGQGYFLNDALKIFKLVSYLDYLAIGRSVLEEPNLVKASVLGDKTTEAVWFSILDLSFIETEQFVRLIQ